MPKVIPFSNRRLSIAERLLILSATREQLSAPAWPASAEPLGNVLQRLALKRPAAAVVLGNIAAEMLAKLDRES